MPVVELSGASAALKRRAGVAAVSRAGCFGATRRKMEAALLRAGASIPSREAGEAFFKLLFTILKNIATKPDDPKYRTIKLSNKVRSDMRPQAWSGPPLTIART